MSSSLDPAPLSPNRIKRHVQGPAHRFALVFPPGFEAGGRAEALARGFKPAEPEPGLPPGLSAGTQVMEWEGKLTDLYRASLFLRIPSRIFLRLKTFRAGAREELFSQVRRLPWELWLAPCPLRVEAHLEHCRISHEGQAAATVLEAIHQRWSECGLVVPPAGGGSESRDSTLDALDSPDSDASVPPASEAGLQRLVLRMEDNHGVLSLDCSGLGLYHRGWRRSQGQAPLRENLAAGLLGLLGWPGQGILVDCMCGSGTFALEGLALARGISSFARDRHFPFQDWPSFQESTWNWQQRQTEGQVVAQARILGLEWHEGVLLKARENGVAFLAGREEGLVSANQIEFREGDFFGLMPESLLHEGEERGFLILNPPYGLRLDDGAGSLYPRLWKHLDDVWPGWTVGVLAPDGRSPPEKGSFTREGRFRHGGLRINFWVNTRKGRNS